MKKFLLLFIASVSFAQTRIAPNQIQPGVNGSCLQTTGGVTVWAPCPATGYGTIQSAGVALAQRLAVNFFGSLICTDNIAQARTDCTLITPLTVSNGGTGLTTLSSHLLYVGNGTSPPNSVGSGNAGQVLISNGASADPSFADPVVSQPTASLLNATVVQATGTNLHTTVDNFPATQPVSGTITTTPPANASTNVTQFGGTNVSTGTGVGGAGIPRVTVSSDSFPATQPISGTVTANAGTNLSTSALALDTSVNGILLSQGSTTSGQKGELHMGAVTTAAPSYTTAQTSPLSLTTSGGLRVDGSGVTQPVSGTVTTTPPANASTNVTQFGGTNVSTGTGVSGAGIPRVTVANDSNILATQSGSWTVTTTPPSNASTNVTQFGGTNVSTGTGTGGAGIPRVTVSSDSFPATQTVAGTVAVGNFPATQAISGTVSTLPPSNASTNLSQVNGWPVAVAKPGVLLFANADGYGRPLSSTGGALNVQNQGVVTTQFASQNFAAAWTSSTTTGSTLILATLNASAVEVSLDNSIGIVTGGTATFEAQDNNSGSWHTVPGIQTGSTFGSPGIGTWAISVPIASAMHSAFVIPVAGYSQFRIRLSSSIIGTGTLAVFGQTTANGSQVVHLAAEGASGQSVASGGSQIPIVQVGGTNASNNLEPISFDASNNLNVAIPEGVDSLTGTNSATWTSATAQNASVDSSVGGIPTPGATTVSVTVAVNGSVTDGALIFEEQGAAAGAFVPVAGVNISTGQLQTPIYNPANSPQTSVTLFSISGAVQDFRVRLLNPIIGSGSVQIVIAIQGMGIPPHHTNIASVGGYPISLTSQAGVGALPIAAAMPDQTVHPIGLSAEGAIFVRPAGLPLPPCNAVRTTNCQHF